MAIAELIVSVWAARVVFIFISGLLITVVFADVESSSNTVFGKFVSCFFMKKIVPSHLELLVP